MTISIMDPVLLAGLLAVGSVVPGSTKRKYTKATCYNGTAAPVTLMLCLVPAAGVANTLTQYVNYSLAPGETYLCPEIVGAALQAGGQMWASGVGLSLSAVASDTINS